MNLIVPCFQMFSSVAWFNCDGVMVVIRKEDLLPPGIRLSLFLNCYVQREGSWVSQSCKLERKGNVSKALQINSNVSQIHFFFDWRHLTANNTRHRFHICNVPMKVNPLSTPSHKWDEDINTIKGTNETTLRNDRKNY